jgi:hypothetical protein
MLPIPSPALLIFENLLAVMGDSKHLFSTGGKRALTIDTLSSAVKEISAGAFQMRDIRRTCETMMAAMGISKDLRAQIQSHGLGGVQDKHYDRHDYMDEKRSALEAWNTRLEEILVGRKKAANVIPIQGAY